MEVKDYFKEKGYDREETLERILATLEEIKKDLDSLLEKDSMEPVTAEEIDALFEEAGSVDMSWIEKI